MNRPHRRPSELDSYFRGIVEADEGERGGAGRFEFEESWDELSDDERRQIVERRNDDGDTIAHVLAAGRRSQFLEKVLAFAPELATTEDAFGAWPIHEAGGGQQLQILVEALDDEMLREAVVERCSWRETTVAHVAAEYGCDEILEDTLEIAGDEVERIAMARDVDGETPLHRACKRSSLEGSKACVRLLIDAGGAELIEQRTFRGKRALHIAVNKGTEDVIEQLFDRGADADVLDKDGLSPLHCIGRRDDVPAQVAKRLLDEGADWRRPDKRGGSILASSNEGVVQGVVEWLADQVERQQVREELSVIDGGGRNILHRIAVKGWMELFQRLDDLLNASVLQRFAIARDAGGARPIHVAVDEEIARELWDLMVASEEQCALFGADYTATNPVHVAAAHGWSELIADWLDGGNTSGSFERAAIQVDDARQTALHKVAGADLQNLPDSLKRGRTSWRGESEESVEAAEILLERFGEELPERRDVNGCTALHIASREGTTELVELLAGFDSELLEVVDYQRRRPIHLVSQARNPEAAQAIADFGEHQLESAGPLDALPVAMAQDEEQAKALVPPQLKPGTSINGRGDTLLHIAVAKGWPEIAGERMIELAGDSECISPELYESNAFLQTPLHVCADREIAEQLWTRLDDSARREVVMTRDVFGESPIHRAADAGWEKLLSEWVELAESHGAFDTENSRPPAVWRGRDGWTPLHYTVGDMRRRGHRDGEPVGALEAGGGGRFRRRGDDETSGRKIAEILLDALDENSKYVDLRNDGGQTPLWVAADNSDAGGIRALVEAGASVNIRDESSETPLHCAAGHYDGEEAVARLLEAGADISARDKKGQRPLHRACSRGNWWSATSILQEGADPNTRDYEGRTALFEAVYCSIRYSEKNVEAGRREVCRLLEELRIDTSIRDITGQNAYFEASEREWMQWLNALDGDELPLTIRDSRDRSLLHECLGNSAKLDEYLLANVDTDTLFEQRDYNGDTPFLEMMDSYSLAVDLVVDLVEEHQSGDREAAVLSGNHNGQTPGHACKSGLVWELLGEPGTNEKWLKRDYSGQTIVASKAGDRCDVTALLFRRLTDRQQRELVDASGEDHFGNYLLHAACDGGSASWVDAVLSSGFEPNRENDRGEGALHIAVETLRERQQATVVRRLLEAGADPTELDREEKTPLDRVAVHEKRDGSRRRFRGRTASYGVQRAFIESPRRLENIWMSGAPMEERRQVAVRSGCAEVFRALNCAAGGLEHSNRKGLIESIAAQTEAPRRQARHGGAHGTGGRLWDAVHNGKSGTLLEKLLARRYEGDANAFGDLVERNGEGPRRNAKKYFSLIETPQQWEDLVDVFRTCERWREAAVECALEWHWFGPLWSVGIARGGPVPETDVAGGKNGLHCRGYEEWEFRSQMPEAWARGDVPSPVASGSRSLLECAEEYARFGLSGRKSELLWRRFADALNQKNDRDISELSTVLRLAVKNRFGLFVRRFLTSIHPEIVTRCVQRADKQHGRTPVYYAGNPESVEMLIRVGANLTVTDRAGLSPIYAWLAGTVDQRTRRRRRRGRRRRRRRRSSGRAHRDLTSMIRLAIESTGAGRMLAVPGRQARTVFHEAARLGSPEVFSALLTVLQKRDTLFRLRAVDEAGNTPLHYASSPPVAEAIIRRCPSLISVENCRGDIPLESIATRIRLEDVVDAYESAGNANQHESTRGNRTAGVGIPGRDRLSMLVFFYFRKDDRQDVFHGRLDNVFRRSCEAGAVDEVCFLIDEVGYELELSSGVDDGDSTVVHSAALGGNLRIMSILGKRLDGTQRDGVSRSIDGSERAEFAELLTPYFAAVDAWGNTPLHYAAVSSDYPLVRLISAAVPAVDPANKTGLSPLHLLAMSRRFNHELRLELDGRRIFEDLVSNGADPKARDELGRTVLDLVLREDDLELFEAYIDCVGGGAAQFNPNAIVDRRRGECILHKLAFHQGASVAAGGASESTQGKEIFGFLCETYRNLAERQKAQELKPNCRDDSGDTPLMIAVRMNMKTIHQELSEVGVSEGELKQDKKRKKGDDDKPRLNDGETRDESPQTSEETKKPKAPDPQNSDESGDEDREDSDTNSDSGEEAPRDREVDEEVDEGEVSVEETEFTHRRFIETFVDTFRVEIDYEARDTATGWTELEWCIHHGDFESAAAIACGWWAALTISVGQQSATPAAKDLSPDDFAEQLVEGWLSDAGHHNSSSRLLDRTRSVVEDEVGELFSDLEIREVERGRTPVATSHWGPDKEDEARKFAAALARLESLRSHLRKVVSSPLFPDGDDTKKADGEEMTKGHRSDGGAAQWPVKFTRANYRYLLWRSVTGYGAFLRGLQNSRLMRLLVGENREHEEALDSELPPGLREQQALLLQVEEDLSRT